MIPFLLTHRTLAEGAGALLLIVLMWGAWIHHDHAMEAIGERSCEARLTSTQHAAELAQVVAAAKYETLIAQPAEIQHAKDLASIPARIVTTPIWLHDGKVCAGALPQVPEAGGDNSSGGGALEGPGRDIRPAIEELKRKYETALADCRRLDAEWPQ